MNIYIYGFQGILFLVAIFANLLSALSGGGAGLIQLPVLLLLGLQFPTALATHKMASVALGIGASLQYFKKRSLKRSFSAFILFCGLPGVLVGSQLALVIPERAGALSLGTLTLFLGIFSAKCPHINNLSNKQEISLTKKLSGGFVLFIIGLINGSLASGTGLFVTIWLVVWFGLSYTSAIAYTLVLVGVVWNGTGAVALAMNTAIRWEWLPALIGGALLGGYIGAHIAIAKGEKLVKKAFEIISFAVGTSLILKAI
ncbi:MULTISPECIES: sulfite exporter TauE/SafE family protein [Prochlorococcus]|uniref:sulfite exporter TauE/SafE family protein n=1 Tax=Prochlorococcus TaxID=1218 RepID=UPI0005339C9B|nr:MULTISPECIES: sulfite exporter TauE/SafE family protein [Prochlorococcus]KGG12672.1 putative permease [Prochlorococcus sp. MIT 0601]